MTEHSGGVTQSLVDMLLEEQRQRAEKERKMTFAKKLRILDRLMQEAKKKQ